MVIECPYCETKVDASVIAHNDSCGPQQEPGPLRASLLECPECKSTLLAGEYLLDPDSGGERWSPVSRLWPAPPRAFPWSVPRAVRASIEEADRCLKANAYVGCVVMCSRALEGVCRHFKTKSPYLNGGLKELLVQEIINRRLYHWGQELEKHRYVVLQEMDEGLSREDADDFFDFVYAICAYVFDLNPRFHRFTQRHGEAERA